MLRLHRLITSNTYKLPKTVIRNFKNAWKRLKNVFWKRIANGNMTDIGIGKN